MQRKTAKNSTQRQICLEGRIGKCGGQEVFIGFASAALLARFSFADVLDEASGIGYQRRFCKEHSLGFKRYIQRPESTTFPLTFNLRSSRSAGWCIDRRARGAATLNLSVDELPALAQVDCQHRLGYLRDSPIEFAFMAFIGLSVVDEMRIFRDINGKAKGLSSSLLDYTEAKLASDQLATAHPDIALALLLQEDPNSPWHHRLDLGGGRTSGTKRIASLRMMQKAVRRFRREARCELENTVVVGNYLIDFWRAVIQVYPYEWAQPRRHLINKGIGIFALMSMAGALVAEGNRSGRRIDQDFFVEKLSDFSDQIDWSNKGPMEGFGGSSGADRAFDLMKSARTSALRGLHAKQEYSAH